MNKRRNTVKPLLLSGLTMLFVLILFGSCQNSSKDENICQPACLDYQECKDSLCVLKEGACNNYLDCAERMICGPMHLCLGPTEPDTQFFEPLAENAVVFDFLGLINSPDDSVASSPTMGQATYQLTFGEQSTTLDEYAYSYSFIMPDDYPVIEVRGLEYIRLQASHVRSQSNTSANFDYLSLGIPVLALRSMQQEQKPQSKLPE